MISIAVCKIGTVTTIKAQADGSCAQWRIRCNPKRKPDEASVADYIIRIDKTEVAVGCSFVYKHSACVGKKANGRNISKCECASIVLRRKTQSSKWLKRTV